MYVCVRLSWHCVGCLFATRLTRQVLILSFSLATSGLRFQMKAFFSYILHLRARRPSAGLFLRGRPLPGRVADSDTQMATDVYAEPPPAITGPLDYVELARQQQYERASHAETSGFSRAKTKNAPKYVVLKYGDREMRRWELPAAQRLGRERLEASGCLAWVDAVHLSTASQLLCVDRSQSQQLAQLGASAP